MTPPPASLLAARAALATRVLAGECDALIGIEGEALAWLERRIGELVERLREKERER